VTVWGDTDFVRMNFSLTVWGDTDFVRMKFVCVCTHASVCVRVINNLQLLYTWYVPILPACKFEVPERPIRWQSCKKIILCSIMDTDMFSFN